MPFEEVTPLEKEQRSQLNISLLAKPSVFGWFDLVMSEQHLNYPDKLAEHRGRQITTTYKLASDVVFITIVRETEPLCRDLQFNHSYFLFIGSGKVEIGEKEVSNGAGNLYKITNEETLYISPQSCVFLAEINDPTQPLPSTPEPNITIVARITHSDGRVVDQNLQEASYEYGNRFINVLKEESLVLLPKGMSVELRLKHGFEEALRAWDPAEPLTSTALDVICDCRTRLDQYERDSIERRFHEIHELGPLFLALYMKYVVILQISKKKSELLRQLSNKQIKRVIESVLKSKNSAQLKQYLDTAVEGHISSRKPKEKIATYASRRIVKRPSSNKVDEDMRASTLNRWQALPITGEGNCSWPSQNK